MMTRSETDGKWPLQYSVDKEDCGCHKCPNDTEEPVEEEGRCGSEADARAVTDAPDGAAEAVEDDAVIGTPEELAAAKATENMLPDDGVYDDGRCGADDGCAGCEHDGTCELTAEDKCDTEEPDAPLPEAAESDDDPVEDAPAAEEADDGLGYDDDTVTDDDDGDEG